MQCWNPSRGQMPADLSPQSLTTNPPLTHPTSSELSCFAACGSPFLCLPASAGARRALDLLGDHRAACPQARILRSRGVALERAAARICREAGARVTTNTRVTDFNLAQVTRQDDRRIEVIANGLNLWGGAQLAIDTTLVSPLTRDGQPRRRAGTYAGAALHTARRSKERTYPEFLQSRRCRLVVLAFETGGRWSHETTNFIRLLAQSKARQAPALLQRSVMAALISRGSAMLSHAAMQSFAASLLDQNLSTHSNVDGNTPPVSQLLAETPPPPRGKLQRVKPRN